MDRRSFVAYLIKSLFSVSILSLFPDIWSIEYWKKIYYKLSGREGELYVGNFERFAFPLIRQTFPLLIASDLVQVQPMISTDEDDKKLHDSIFHWHIKEEDDRVKELAAELRS
jgi:hypothetical protein